MSEPNEVSGVALTVKTLQACPGQNVDYNKHRNSSKMCSCVQNDISVDKLCESCNGVTSNPVRRTCGHNDMKLSRDKVQEFTQHNGFERLQCFKDPVTLGLSQLFAYLYLPIR